MTPVWLYRCQLCRDGRHHQSKGVVPRQLRVAACHYSTHTHTPPPTPLRVPRSAQIVVNLRTIDGSVKRRCEFRTSLSLTDVKHLMAERVYGPHARDLPPSRIRLAACAPTAGASRMSPQQAGSGATGSSGRRCVGGAGAGAGAGAGSAASAARGTAIGGVAQSAVDDGFEIDSVSSITPELVITVSVLPVPETGAGTGRSRSLPEPPLSHRTAGTSHAEHGGVAAPATPTRAKAASVPGATSTTPM